MAASLLLHRLEKEALDGAKSDTPHEARPDTKKTTRRGLNDLVRMWDASQAQGKPIEV
ncbi:hypothetical protein [Bacteriophage sp.]|nr:hypothetical protein [Bacteriophage sp.]